MENLVEKQIPNLVVGRVSDANNQPLPNLIVQVFDRDLRSEQLLTETITDQDGKYKIKWMHSQLSGRGKKEADLSIKVLSAEKKVLLYSSDTDSIRFNASRREEINVVIAGYKPDVVEYESMLKEVTFLAGNVAVADLQENKEFRDITFISKETSISNEKISYLILSHRLQNASKIHAPFFYALLRKGTLLKNDFSKSMKMRLSIDISSQIQTILYDAALTDPKIIHADVQDAVKEMIVDSNVLNELNRDIEMLNQYKEKALEYYKKEYPDRVFNTVTRFVTEGKIQEAEKLFQENKDNLNAFFEKIADPSFFTLNGKAAALGNVDLGAIFGIGKDLIPNVIKAKGLNNPADVKKLARLNKSDWVSELTKAKENTGNKDDHSVMINLMASTIVRKMEKQFPTIAFTAQLERENKPVFKNHDKIVSFLSKHDDFDLGKHNIDLYLKDKNSSELDDKAKEELKSIQRIFKLSPQYSTTNALLKQNIHSAQGIVSVGESRFVKEIAPKVGLQPKEATEIYKKAERINTGAMLIVGELQDTLRGMDIASLESSTMALKLEAVSKDFPNLKTLFKLTDTCACEQCRSVYSPAAYLVEILQFLEKRSVTDLTVTPHVTSNLAKDVLFERRPDLGDIDLGCENANTPVKYIDLVCEILEEVIAPDQGIPYSGNLSDGPNPLQGVISANLLSTLTAAGLPVTNKALIFETEVASGSADTLPHYLRDTKIVCKIVNDGGGYKVFRLRQTLSSAEELDAAPEYVNENAYTELRNKSFAFKLPFDKDHVEGNSYLNRFDMKRSDLMKNFKLTPGTYDPNIAAEVLGLTDSERLIIVTPKPSLADQQLVWNAPAQWDSPPVSGNVLDYMKRVDHFLDKTGLLFTDLDLLLKLKYIDPLNNLYIYNKDLTCDTQQKEIANLNEAALDRIHRFLRLQKKTGWSFVTLDEIISQPNLGNGKLDDGDDNGDGVTNGNECLMKAACLYDISLSTNIKMDELIGFYGDIPHTIISEDIPKPLYYQVFLNKAKNGFVDEGLLPEKVDGSQLLSTYKSSIAVCLQLKQKDLDLLLATLPDDKLNFSNLSYLYASARIIKKLKLKTSDYLIFLELTGLSLATSPFATMDFQKAVEGFKYSPLKAADVRYVLRHEALLLPDLDGKIKQILETLQKEYQNNFTLNRSKFDPNLTSQEQMEAFQTELSKLNTVSEDDVKKFTEFIDKNWTNATDAKNFVDDKLGSLFDTTQIKAKIDELDAETTKDQDILDQQSAEAALSAAQEELKKATTASEIAAANADIAAAEAQLLITTPKYNIASGKNLIKAFLDSIALYQLEAGKRSILEQITSTNLKADLDFVRIVLKYAQLKQIAPGNQLVSSILESDDLIDTDPTHVVPVLPAITKVGFPNEYAAIKLLDKLLPLINSFKLSNDNLEWIFQNSKNLGWFEWDSIPFDVPGQVPVSYDKYIKLAGEIQLSKEFFPVTNSSTTEDPISFISTMSMVLTGSTTRTQFIDAVAILTGYEPQDIDDIDAYFFPVFDIANYKDFKNVQRWIDSAEILRKLVSPLSQVKEYLKPVLTNVDVSNLRVALKSRYDEDTWLETLKEIMDAIRPQKRDALVAYILATNPDLKDENDLFDYFLVDVEMEACMPSSRIVQAHGTVQLFVQRCLMGLEPKAAADVDNDANWTQWKWMKNYRVWEANRKVFLYPENWLSPDLRDNKSFLFTEFENELQQSELTDVSAEECLIRYMEKLDNIAFLEVMASWYQVDIKTMHVFARTKGGDPSIYYYRRFEQERYWTPWEKVDLDIPGNQLLAFVRNNRLCLAWPVYSDINDPDQGATIPDQSDTSEQPVDKPRKKLKIQLAISEFSNNKWQPKKISQDGIQTPDYYTTTPMNRDQFNLMYIEKTQQVWIFTNTDIRSNEYNIIEGIFNITGCKGYPELQFQGNQYFPGFLPDFRDTSLKSQRYFEMNQDQIDDLAVRNGMSIFNFYEILNTTPGNFRLTYDHQFTNIDLIVMLFEYLSMLILKNNFESVNRKNGFKIPLGTLLPYFMEDSKHAYVIIPGFYKKMRYDGNTDNGRYILTDVEKRTVSDVFQLLDDISNFGKKIKLKYQTTPPPDLNTLIHDIITDPDFQHILDELSSYEGFDNFYSFLMGINQNAELDAVLEKLKDADGLVYGEQFKNMYHPLVCSLRTTLYKYGIPELMKRDTQLQKTAFNFKTNYHPNTAIVPETQMTDENGGKFFTYPIEDLDFSSDGSYSCYNWELFYHLPLLLATRLTQNQKFEDALTWFHYMFNPTGALKGNTPQKYWVTKPFYLNQEADYISQRIDTLLYKIADPTTPERKELEFAIDEWRNNPFKPDVVARFRPVAYQKSLLMKYIDNLVAWGDNLFRQDTMESIAQATQMYILADKLLGPKPRIIPSTVKQPYETYNQIKNKLDAFGNALIDLENILPDLSVLPEGGAELPPPPVTLSMLYFCIPQNDNMLAYWDLISDRLFKIRHCQNIDGIERSLALFAPPIDPGMLVRAAASGLDISAVIAGINAPTPFYRFNILTQKATELAQEVRNLGNSLLATLEKKDVEALALLRNELEMKVLNAIKDLKKLQIDEAKEQIEILKKTRKVTEERDNFYTNVQKINTQEQLNLDKLDEAIGWQTAANITYTLGAILALVPDFALGVSGFGGSPHGAAKFGGSLLAHSTDAVGKGLGIFGALASYEANRASIMGGHERRFDDWKLQERLAKRELDQIDKQIAAATIREQIAETDLANHEIQIDNSKKTEDFLTSKFTNVDLYNWMIGQISSVYFSAYQLSHDYAKKAERCYQFELGNDDTFISYGYWDSMKKGLLCADHLITDIKRMETNFIDKNKREFEITKHISLAMLDPLALIRLRYTGVCDFEIPEALFDLDYPGHYFRRSKSLSISLPAIAGPVTSISAKLSLINNRYRKITNPDNSAGTGYEEDPGNDERFIYNVGSIQSIATSNAQNDSGIFELNFRDERYLPFEGTGAVSSWRLELPTEIRQFDYNTISDVIIHMKYTSRDGGSGLKGLANASLMDRLAVVKQQLGQEGLHVALNLKHDLSNEWYLLKKNSSVDITVSKNRFPYMAQTLDATIEEVMFVARIKNNPATFSLNVDGNTVNLSRIDEWQLCKGTSTDIELDTAFTLSIPTAQINNLDELLMVVKYSF